MPLQLVINPTAGGCRAMHALPKVEAARLPLGRLVYLYGLLATVFAWKPDSFTCSVDGIPLSLSGWSVAVANTGMYGGGDPIAALPCTVTVQSAALKVLIPA